MNDTCRTETHTTRGLTTETCVTKYIQAKIKGPVYCPECGERLAREDDVLLHRKWPDSTCVHDGKRFKPPTVPLEVIEDQRKKDDALLPCFSCESQNLNVVSCPDEAYVPPERYYVICLHCAARGPRRPLERTARSRWNQILRPGMSTTTSHASSDYCYTDNGTITRKRNVVDKTGIVDL